MSPDIHNASRVHVLELKRRQTWLCQNCCHFFKRFTEKPCDTCDNERDVFGMTYGADYSNG